MSSGHRRRDLTDVRHGYARFIQRLAERVRQLDPNHPVITVHEHNHQLPGAVLDFAVAAPSLHAIGVNSYYRQNIAYLDDIMSRLDPARPYLVAEFGPDGYWHKDYTERTALGRLTEASAVQKAELYRRRWDRFIQARAGNNLGGVAFCWRDRYEGTATWFGLTDREGRLKPAYYGLRQAWTGQRYEQGVVIESLDLPRNRVIAGRPFEVRAQLSPGQARVQDMTWRMLSASYHDVGSDVQTFVPDQAAVRLTAPRRPGWYRVHLQVRDAQGRLDELSAPLWVLSESADARPVAISLAGRSLHTRRVANDLPMY